MLRIWPNQLIVRVRERHPVAFAKLPVGVSGQFRYLADRCAGRAARCAAAQRFDFPVLTGVTEEQSEAERRDARHRDAATAATIGPGGASMISEINAASTRRICAYRPKINGRSLELWLGDRNYLARFQNFTNHFDEIPRRSDGAIASSTCG